MKAFLLVTMMAIPAILFSQEAIESNDEPNKESKLEQFTSKSGEIVRFIDYHMSSPKLLYLASAKTLARSVHVANQIQYFLIIEHRDKYRTYRAAIAHEDLLEVIKAFDIIKEQAPKDIAMAPDYLENRFITGDGFRVGYFVERGKISWYMRLESGSGSTIFPRDENEINKLFHQADEKINELKAENTD